MYAARSSGGGGARRLPLAHLERSPPTRAAAAPRQVVNHVRACFPRARGLYAAGWSLGANILVNYLGEEGANTPLQAAVSMCARGVGGRVHVCPRPRPLVPAPQARSARRARLRLTAPATPRPPRAAQVQPLRLDDLQRAPPARLQPDL